MLKTVLVRGVVNEAANIAGHLLRRERIGSEGVNVMEKQDLTLAVNAQLPCHIAGQLAPQIGRVNLLQ